MPKPTVQDLENRFIYHPPKTDSRKAKHQKVTDLSLAGRQRWALPAGLAEQDLMRGYAQAVGQ